MKFTLKRIIESLLITPASRGKYIAPTPVPRNRRSVTQTQTKVYRTLSKIGKEKRHGNIIIQT